MTPYIKYYMGKIPEDEQNLEFIPPSRPEYEETIRTLESYELSKKCLPYEEYCKRGREQLRQMKNIGLRINTVIAENENDPIIAETENSELFVRWHD